MSPDNSEEDTFGDPCVVCNMPADDTFKGKRYCEECKLSRIRRQVQW